MPAHGPCCPQESGLDQLKPGGWQGPNCLTETRGECHTPSPPGEGLREAIRQGLPQPGPHALWAAGQPELQAEGPTPPPPWPRQGDGGARGLTMGRARGLLSHSSRCTCWDAGEARACPRAAKEPGKASFLASSLGEPWAEAGDALWGADKVAESRPKFSAPSSSGRRFLASLVYFSALHWRGPCRSCLRAGTQGCRARPSHG